MIVDYQILKHDWLWYHGPAPVPKRERLRNRQLNRKLQSAQDGSKNQCFAINLLRFLGVTKRVTDAGRHTAKSFPNNFA